MRRLSALVALTATLWLGAATAQAADSLKPAAATAANAAAANNAAAAKKSAGAAIPADVRAKVVAKLHGATPDDVALSPIPGIYEVTMGGLVAYVSADGKYLFSGNVYDLDSQENLTATRRNTARAKALAAVPESQMIIYGPSNPKMTVTVFTDVDCGFCRKFHGQMAELNKAGVRVRYMFFPRTGPGTESWAKAEQVWCSADRRDALTRAKRGEPIKGKTCGDAVVKTQYEMGSDMGVEGTPAIFTQNGDYIGGFLTTQELVASVQESLKATTATAAR